MIPVRSWPPWSPAVGPCLRRGVGSFLCRSLLILALALVSPPHAWPQDLASVIHATVGWVNDGDTVVLADGRRVRYLGINAPEVAHGDHPGEPYGPAARRFNRSLVAGCTVRLETAGQGRDRYGRLLADVFLADGRFVNLALVSAGLAHVLSGSGPEPRAGQLLAAQRRAMTAGEGMWRRLRTGALTLVGNRRSRRFHRPDCPFAKKIQ